MATLDALAHLDGRPANFLDVPPVLEVSRVKEAFLLVLSNPELRCLLVNVFGAGIMRCDTIADGLLLAHLEQPVKVPLVMRLAGTNAPLAVSRLERSGLSIQFASDLESAAKTAVERAQHLALTPKPRSITDRLSSWFSGTRTGSGP